MGWDLCQTPAVPSTLGLWGLTLTVGLLGLLVFGGLNFSVSHMPANQLPMNVGGWALSTLLCGGLFTSFAIRIAEKNYRS